MHSYYDVLGVAPDASGREIRDAYRKLIKIHHPDTNRDSEEATRHSQLLNEAYATLKDPVSRAEYDSWLSLRATATEAEEQEGGQQENTSREYRCESCGKQDSSLRVSVFIWVLSLVLYSQKDGTVKILCDKCRALHAAGYTLQVWLCGWWGIPWGPIFSIEALAKNLFGAIGPGSNNAALLAMVGYDLYRSGDFAEAEAALEESLRLRPDSDVSGLLLHLRSIAPTGSRPKPQPFWRKRLSVLSASLVNVAAIVCVSWIISNLGGGEARPVAYEYERGRSDNLQTTSTVRVSKTAANLGIDLSPLSNVVRETNSEVRGLGLYLERTLPIVDTTYEVNKTIYHYVLDRTLLASDSLNQYASRVRSLSSRAKAIGLSLRQEIHSSECNPETRSELAEHERTMTESVCAATFNIELLALSTECISAFNNNGRLSMTWPKRIRKMAADPTTSAWLSKTRFGASVGRLADLVEAIVISEAGLRISLSEVAELESRLSKANRWIDSVDSKMERLLRNDRTAAYNSLVDIYNDSLEEYYALFEQYESTMEALDRQAASFPSADLDSAFNECLDPGILSSSFEIISITPKTEASRK